MKQVVKTYVINSGAKTITLTDYSTVLLERLYLITDVTNQTILYQFNTTTGVTAATNVLTFTTLGVTGNTDKLQIIYDNQTSDPTYDTPPLPAGAATSAKQPALGTAGTASGDVLTVQGKTSMTPLLVDPSGVTSPVSLASVPSHAVTNAGTFATQAAQSGTWTVQPGNTANTTAWKVDGSAVTQPVSGTVTTTPPSNASTNVAQVAGTTADTNSGNKSAGTLRVVLATDQPALTNKLLVTPDSVALPANQSVNHAQVSGTTTSVSNGTTDAGTQRVTLSSDSTGQVKLATGTNSIGTVGSNSATASGVPTTAHYIGVKSSASNLVGLLDVAGNGVTGGGAAGLLGVGSYSYNGSNYDVRRSNEAVTLLASASRTTTQTSADLVNFNGLSFLDVILDATVIGTGSLTLTINGKDPASGKYYLLLSGAAVTTNSTNRYRVSPYIAATTNAIAQDVVPRTFQIVVTANNANAVTYSVGYNLSRAA